MNVFILDRDQRESARAHGHTEKHVGKMCLEAVQICNTALSLNGLDEYMFYKPTHETHPWCEFAAEGDENFSFVLEQALELGEEYQRRKGETHLSHKKVVTNWMDGTVLDIFDALPSVDFELSDVPQAVGDYTRPGEPIEAYRDYYRNEKMTKDWFEYQGDEEPDWYRNSQVPAATTT